MMVRTNRTIKGKKLMTAKKLNLDIFKDSEIEHDKTFIDKDVLVFSCEDPKRHEVVSYSALTQHGEYFIPVADGPEVQSFLDGSCFILENKGKVVAIGKGHRYLKVDGKNIVTHSKEPHIVINNKLDPVTTLYDPNGNAIGKIRNNAAWLDVCAQIHTKQLEGYYVMFKGVKIIISKMGGVKHVPSGFYDSCDASLDILLDLN